MKTKIRFFLLIVVIAAGCWIISLSDRFLITKEGPILKADLEALHEMARTDGEESFTDFPRIDFPALDEARSLDLIDMQLEFPESLKALEGERVSLVGFMAPFDSLEDMQRCMIVPSYVGCTFCSPPSMTQVVYVNQGKKNGAIRSFPFIEEPSYITGTFRLTLPESDHEGAQHGFLYFIEDAVVTPYTGSAPERVATHQSVQNGQVVHQPGASLPALEASQLLGEVSSLIGREPLRPIEVEVVSAKKFSELVRIELEEVYPEASRASRVRAFSMFGMIPEDCDWIDLLADARLARRSAIRGRSGERVYLLSSVDQNHPYVRLDLVGAMTDAIIQQHFPLPSPEGKGGNSGSGALSEDARRAHEGLRAGIRGMAVYRYSRKQGIPPSSPLPTALFQRSQAKDFVSVGIEVWQDLPGNVGPFFVDYFVGATGAFSGIDVALAEPPSATIELFRPRWYEDDGLWQSNPVPIDFADTIIDNPPSLTGVLGLGGLVPWLLEWYSVDAAKSLVGRWAGDRWAVWLFPDGSSALILETRWQDEESAVRFREAVPEDPRQVKLPYEADSRVVRMIRATSEEALLRLTQGVALAGSGR